MGNVTLNNQAEIDAFVSEWPDCTDIDGALQIGQLLSPQGAPPLDLSGLSGIISVKKLLVGGAWENYPNPIAWQPISILSLVPLNGITGKVDSIFIGHIEFSEELPPFSGVTEMGHFNIRNVGGITATPEFPALVSLKSFRVWTGLSLIDDILEEVRIPDSLEEFTYDVESQDYWPGRLELFGLSTLTAITGGESLVKVANINIRDVPMLENLDAFDQLEKVDELHLHVCSAGALESFRKLTTGNIQVALNPENEPDCNATFENVTVRLGEDATNLEDLPRPSLRALLRGAHNATFTMAHNKLHNLGLLFDGVIIQGLNTLDSLSGNLVLSLPQVPEFPDFSSLVHVGGNFAPFGTPIFSPTASVYSDFSGLGNLNRIDGTCNLRGSLDFVQLLETLDGLENLWHIGNGLDIRDLNELIDVSSLSGLESLSGDLFIRDLPLLDNFEGINILTGSIRNISFGSNAQINAFPHFTEIDSVNGFIYIIDNPQLTAFEFPDDVVFGGLGLLAIIDNPLLEACGQQPSICNLIASANTANIHSNGQGCNDAEAITAECAALSSSDLPASEIRVYVRNGRYLMIENEGHPRQCIAELYASDGQAVMNRQLSLFSGTNEIPLPGLGSGVYLLLLSADDHREVYKVPVFK